MTPLETLKKIAVDCAEPNWDHDGAEAVNPHTAGLTLTLLVVMQQRGLAVDHIVPTVDGGIMLGGDAEQNCTLTIKANRLWPAPSEAKDGNDQPGD